MLIFLLKPYHDLLVFVSVLFFVLFFFVLNLELQPVSNFEAKENFLIFPSFRF